MNERRSQRMRSIVNWAVLGLVIERPGYAYELAKRFECAYEGALSLSSVQDNPAPAAQLATGCASNPGPGWYGGFHGRPRLRTDRTRM